MGLATTGQLRGVAFTINLTEKGKFGTDSLVGCLLQGVPLYMQSIITIGLCLKSGPLGKGKSIYLLAAE